MPIFKTDRFYKALSKSVNRDPLNRWILVPVVSRKPNT